MSQEILAAVYGVFGAIAGEVSRGYVGFKTMPEDDFRAMLSSLKFYALIIVVCFLGALAGFIAFKTDKDMDEVRCILAGVAAFTFFRTAGKAATGTNSGAKKSPAPKPVTGSASPVPAAKTAPTTVPPMAPPVPRSKIPSIPPRRSAPPVAGEAAPSAAPALAAAMKPAPSMPDGAGLPRPLSGPFSSASAPTFEPAASPASVKPKPTWSDLFS